MADQQTAHDDAADKKMYEKYFELRLKLVHAMRACMDEMLAVLDERVGFDRAAHAAEMEAKFQAAKKAEADAKG